MLRPFKNSLSDDLLAEHERGRDHSATLEDGRVSDATGVAPVDSSIEKVAPSGTTTLKPLAHLKTGGFFAPWLFHGSKSSYPQIVEELRNSVLAEPVAPYSDKDLREAYYNPSITNEKPKLWIARDTMGISRYEVAETSKVIEITDEGASFNEKGKVVWEQDSVLQAPIWEEKPEY